MEWYKYTIQWKGRQQAVIQQMTRLQAAELGAEHVPAEKVREHLEPLLVGLAVPLVDFQRDGDLERGYSLEEEAPHGRL